MTLRERTTTAKRPPAKGRTIMIDPSPPGSSSWRYRRAAILSFLFGTAPILVNLLASQVASWLGCYITEYSVYSRSGTSADFSDDVPGCLAGSTDIGSVLVSAHSFGLAFSLTWPLLLLSAALWIWPSRRRFRAND